MLQERDLQSRIARVCAHRRQTAKRTIRPDPPEPARLRPAPASVARRPPLQPHPPAHPPPRHAAPPARPHPSAAHVCANPGAPDGCARTGPAGRVQTGGPGPAPPRPAPLRPSPRPAPSCPIPPPPAESVPHRGEFPGQANPSRAILHGKFIPLLGSKLNPWVVASLNLHPGKTACQVSSGQLDLTRSTETSLRHK